MPTQPYFSQVTGERFPGTTTIIGDGLGWNKRQLMAWVDRERQAGRDYKDTSGRAADAGTLAHAMAEADITGTSFEAPPNTDQETLQKAEQAFKEYLSWKEMSRLKIVKAEVALVSEQYRYGGTIDGIAEFKDGLALIDFKTANGTYPDHLIQLAAYQNLWEENYPDRLLTKGLFILRFSKHDADWHAHKYAELSDAWSVFKNLREMYDLKKKLERRAA